MKKKDALIYTLTMASFGFIGILVREIGFPSVVCAWLRAIIASLSLLIYILISKRNIDWKETRSAVVPMVLSGIFISLDWFGLFSAYRYTTVANATIVYYIVPILILLFTPVFLDEKFTSRHLICSVVAFIGMAFTCGIVQNGFKNLNLIGPLYSFLGACSYAAIVFINKRHPKGDVLVRTTIQLITSSIAFTPFVLVTEDVSTLLFTPRTVLYLLLLGVGITALGYILYYYEILKLEGKSIAILSYADPVTAILVSILIMKEPITVYSVIGSVLIIGSAMVSELKADSKTK